MKTRIVIVDDHSIIRAGLRSIIKPHEEFEVVAEAGSAAEAIVVIKKAMPNLVLMDVSMPDGDGITVCRQVLELLPDTRIIMISGLSDEKTVNQSIQAGAVGYMLKSNASSELMPGLKAVLDGYAFLSPEVTYMMLQGYKNLLNHPTEASSSSVLSDREREVLKLLGQGLRTKEIAQQLGIGAKTVETYRARLLTKLECGSTNELVRYAIREGICPA
jgi:DNA-binding NarL/FixJ family response regulator